MQNPRIIASRMTLAVCLLGLTLSGCQKSAVTGNPSDNGQPATAPPIAALPLATASAPPPLAYAPAAAALPSGARHIAQSLRHGRERYGYTDRAYAMSNAFGDTPPDYTVDYEGTRPWVWRANDGGYRVVEQLPDGQRSYYYGRGADRPFYITDSAGGYAYDGGRLVGIYGPNGAPLSDSYAAARADAAARYYGRAAAIYLAANHSQRQAAYAADWRARRALLVQQRQRWDEARMRDADWMYWHDQHQRDEDRIWQAERDRRSAYAATIGAAVFGAAVLVSGNHGDGGNDRAGPPAPQRQGEGGPPRNDAGSPPAQPNGAGYGQRPNGNPAHAGNAQPVGNRGPFRAQGPTAPVVQPGGIPPVAPLPPQGAGGGHPQNRPGRPAAPVIPQAPAPTFGPAHQIRIIRGPSAPLVVPAAPVTHAPPVAPALRVPPEQMPAPVRHRPDAAARSAAVGAAPEFRRARGGGGPDASPRPAPPVTPPPPVQPAVPVNRPHPVTAPAAIAPPIPPAIHPVPAQRPVPVAGPGSYIPPVEMGRGPRRAPIMPDAGPRRGPVRQPTGQPSPDSHAQN